MSNDSPRCPHCQGDLPEQHTFNRTLEHGRAYGEACPHCSKLVTLRHPEPSDPPIPHPLFTEEELGRMDFFRKMYTEPGDNNRVYPLESFAETLSSLLMTLDPIPTD